MKVRETAARLRPRTPVSTDCSACDPFQSLPFGDPWPTAATTTVRAGLRATMAFNG